jgi:hypothetical protein
MGNFQRYLNILNEANFRDLIKDKTFKFSETGKDVGYWDLPEADRVIIRKEMANQSHAKEIAGLQSGKAKKDFVLKIQDMAAYELGKAELSDKDKKTLEDIEKHSVKVMSHMDGIFYREIKDKAMSRGNSKLGNLWSKFGGDILKIQDHLKSKGATESVTKLEKYIKG